MRDFYQVYIKLFEYFIRSHVLLDNFSYFYDVKITFMYILSKNKLNMKVSLWLMQNMAIKNV